MPRISQLPTNTELTGNELIAVVQDGETRKVTLSDALIAHHEVSASNARWIKSSASQALINNPVAAIDENNNKPMTFTAKVDAVLNPTDTIIWDYGFAMILVESPQWERDLVYSDEVNGEWGWTSGNQIVSGGMLRFTVMSGIDEDHRDRILVFTKKESAPDSQYEYVMLLSPLYLSGELLIPYDEYENTEIRMMVQQGVSFPILLKLECLSYWETNGAKPVITTAGNELNVSCQEIPRPGTLTAYAKIFDESNLLIATSNNITLNIAKHTSGGGC